MARAQISPLIHDAHLHSEQTMPFSLKRHEVVEYLTLLGIDLPARAQLTDEKLDKRLSLVLDSCQYISRVVPNPPLIPTMYPTWIDAPGNKLLNEVICRTNPNEADFLGQLWKQGIMMDITTALRTTPLNHLRAMLLLIALGVQRGSTRFACADEAKTSTLRIKVLEVRKFDSSTPIFIVQYQHYERSKFYPGWAQNMAGATLQQQNLLARILRRNSKRIEPTYRPDGLEVGNGFDLSFLIPIGPLTLKDRGKHSTIEGCPNCGETAVDLKKCARCLGVSYCSRECQKNHWKAHRLLCQSVSSGTWQEVVVRRPKMIHFSSSTIVGNPEDELGLDEHLKTTPPENIHGAEPFLLKLVLKLDDEDDRIPCILLYDRQQSFRLILDSEENEAFEVVSKVVEQKTERATGYPTIHCWAKRTADWALRLCLDPLPEQPNW
ncbi:MYND-type domain-containing protein [Mycena sanguinolenta]|uniref:MYND-type domain-containing protein n=1 Tax=Mycena sanguinolenta TaxID=230812 RepID=A0A8H7DJM4_9AGAR|nr:MYND-type domain-containing protein [Mycena sanguinolenta]